MTKAKKPIKKNPYDKLFKNFVEFVYHYQRHLNLEDWNIKVSRSTEDSIALAQVMCDPLHRHAHMIMFECEEMLEAHEKKIEQVALHECLHILLAELVSVNADARSSEEHCEMAEESVIRVLEKRLLS